MTQSISFTYQNVDLDLVITRFANTILVNDSATFHAANIDLRRPYACDIISIEIISLIELQNYNVFLIILSELARNAVQFVQTSNGLV